MSLCTSFSSSEKRQKTPPKKRVEKYVINRRASGQRARRGLCYHLDLFFITSDLLDASLSEVKLANEIKKKNKKREARGRGRRRSLNFVRG